MVSTGQYACATVSDLYVETESVQYGGIAERGNMQRQLKQLDKAFIDSNIYIRI